VAAIAFGLVLGVRGGNLATLVLCVSVAVVSLIPILADQTQSPEKRNILLSLFCLAYIARYVISPIILYVPESGVVDVPGMYLSMLRPWDVAMGEFVVLVALLSFLAGHMIPVARTIISRTSRSYRDWSPAVTLAIGVGLILFGWLISIATSLGLIPAALGSGVVSILASSMIYGNVLLALGYFRYGSRFALIVLVAIVPVTMLVGFLSGSKTSTLLPIAFVALTYVLEKRRVPVTFIAVGALLLAVIYPASEYVRAYLLRGEAQSVAELLKESGSATSDVSEYVRSREMGDYLSEGFSAVAARLDSTGVVSVIVRDTPRLSPYQNGSTLVLFFVSFVPRALWPEKPNIAIGQFITDVYGSGPEVESSTGPSQIGDYYLNFGYGGVIAGMFTLGVLFRIAFEFLLARRRCPSAPALLATIAILFSIVITFETNVALAQSRVFFFLVPIVALDYFVRLLGGTRKVESGVSA
jgi:hypothetical protein